ncbi:hypothetical protein pb186bvf_004301 [Paramecium bursaria]
MGIKDLLRNLKSLAKPMHVSKYSGMKVAIDSYCWLHKGIFSCAQDIVEGRDTDVYINFCIRKVQMLQSHNIKVVMVFDGGLLPSKQITESEREKKRKENLSKAEEFRSKGDHDKAHQKYAESIDVTPKMAQRLLKALQSLGIECIVAPFEADAQLAYLSITEYIDIVITEDSDLLAYGAKKVFFKMDKQGNGEQIDISTLDQCKEYNFQGWDSNKFLTLCILAGCDYLDSISGVGFSKAYAAIMKTQNYKQAIDFFYRSSKFFIPDGYVQKFEQAFLTFRFQYVFCPVQRKIVNLHDLDVEEFKNNKNNGVIDGHMLLALEQSKEMDYIGTKYSDEIAQQIADGKICPQNLKPYPAEIQDSKFASQTLKVPIYGKDHMKFQVFHKARHISPIQVQEKQKIKLKQKTVQSYFQTQPKRKQMDIDKNIQQDVSVDQSSLQDNSKSIISTQEQKLTFEDQIIQEQELELQQKEEQEQEQMIIKEEKIISMEDQMKFNEIRQQDIFVLDSYCEDSIQNSIPYIKENIDKPFEKYSILDENSYSGEILVSFYLERQDLNSYEIFPQLILYILFQFKSYQQYCFIVQFLRSASLLVVLAMWVGLINLKKFQNVAAGWFYGPTSYPEN